MNQSSNFTHIEEDNEGRLRVYALVRAAEDLFPGASLVWVGGNWRLVELTRRSSQMIDGICEVPNGVPKGNYFWMRTDGSPREGAPPSVYEEPKKKWNQIPACGISFGDSYRANRSNGITNAWWNAELIKIDPEHLKKWRSETIDIVDSKKASDVELK